jgi:hypothetical protein
MGKYCGVTRSGSLIRYESVFQKGLRPLGGEVAQVSACGCVASGRACVRRLNEWRAPQRR